MERIRLETLDALHSSRGERVEEKASLQHRSETRESYVTVTLIERDAIERDAIESDVTESDDSGGCITELRKAICPGAPNLRLSVGVRYPEMKSIHTRVQRSWAAAAR
jgi:hypothetical protein